MTHKTASIWKYVKTAGGWRYCKPVIKPNHKIDPRRVLVKGKIEECPSGQFYLCIAGRWLAIGNDPVEALKAQQKEIARLAAIANGFDLPDAIKQESETIADAIADFMDGYRIRKSVKKEKIVRSTPSRGIYSVGLLEAQTEIPVYVCRQSAMVSAPLSVTSHCTFGGME